MYSNLCRHIYAFLSLITLLPSLHLELSILFQMEGTTNNRSMVCVGRKMWLQLGLKVGCISCCKSRCLFTANVLQELPLDITYGTIFSKCDKAFHRIEKVERLQADRETLKICLSKLMYKGRRHDASHFHKKND